jgi:hypothetical protein
VTSLFQQSEVDVNVTSLNGVSTLGAHGASTLVRKLTVIIFLFMLMLAETRSNNLSSLNTDFIPISSCNFSQASFIFLSIPFPVQFIEVSYSFSLATIVIQATVM